MTWVKVCGLRDVRHVAAVEEVGGDAIGVVLAPDSPRRVTLAEAALLVAATTLDTYLVMVDATPEHALAAVAATGASGIQPHGLHAAETAAAAQAEGLHVLRPVPVEGPIDLSYIPDGEVPLLDTSIPGRHGGTGLRWEPGLAAGLDRRWVLAGGLTPDNVREAIHETGPWGVDASSGLESSPGQKDSHLIRRFIEEAKKT